MINNKMKIYFVALVVLLMMAMLPVVVYSQEYNNLTRGKMWTGENYGASTYPGYYEANTMNSLRGQSTERMVFWHNGKQEMKKDRQLDRRVDVGEGKIEMVVPYTVHKNYNFENSLDLPEEYAYCEIMSVADPLRAPNAHIRVKSTSMVWSLPKYDDFVILKQTYINEEAEPLTDLYISKLTLITMTGGLSFDWDTEYEWHSDIKSYTDEQGAFIFYDDTELPPSSPDQPVVYSISPGDVTGDRGNPGNILNVNSIDFKLYSPQVQCEIVVDCTPNKNGEKKVRKHIFSDPAHLGASEAPLNERFMWDFHTPDQMMDFFMREQTREDWVVNKDNPNTTDGTVYERNPQAGFTIGPYDLAPGDSINLLVVRAAGEMDRYVSLLGGLDATQRFKAEGIANLKENIDAAYYLIEHNYRPEAYPPPTPADVPEVFNDEDNVLLIEPFVDIENVTQGFDVRWYPIDESYVDPIKGINDLAGYRIYKSELSVMGPWELIEELTKEQANALIQDGRITYRVEAEVGIPTHFSVTTFDTDNLESGRTAYNYYPVYAKAAPSNDMSKVMVVPNPFKQTSGLPNTDENKRLVFVNIPAQCTIKIYTVVGELVQTLNHDDGYGLESWGTSEGNDYMGTQFFQNVAPGVYIYHVESHVSGHEGETEIGKFIIIK